MVLWVFQTLLGLGDTLLLMILLQQCMQTSGKVTQMVRITLQIVMAEVDLDLNHHKVILQFVLQT